MLRAAAAALLLCTIGCGRIGFDAVVVGAEPDGGLVDAIVEPVDASFCLVASDPLDAGETPAPTVVLLVDQSRSMQEPLEGRGGTGPSRWNVLRDSLLAPSGIVDALDGEMNIGLGLFSAASTVPGGPLPSGECPALTYVTPALNNFDAIESAYSAAEPFDNAPTAAAIRETVDRISDDPELDPSNTVLIIATDGAPDSCDDLTDTGLGRAQTEAAVTRAFDMGVRTYAIAVGDGTVPAEHLRAVAEAGVGRPGAPYWEAGDELGLLDALSDVLTVEVMRPPCEEPAG